MLVLSLMAVANALGISATASESCPYQSGDGSSMFCSRATENHGHCPELQKKRIVAFNKFYANSYSEFMKSAQNFTLADIFNKKDKLVGDETYEQMIMQHVKCMSVPESATIEDKITLKQTAEAAGVPVTDWYFGAHLDDFSKDNLATALTKVCEDGVDSFIIKATHMAWSMGQKIVRNFQARCKDGLQAEIDALGDFIEHGVLSLRNTDPDSQHLAEALKPGVIIEELFSTGGLSRKPLEAKALVVWGKVFDIWMLGEDHRGCKIVSGTWKVYGDGTGWNLNGMMGEKDDPASDFFMKSMFKKIKDNAENFAGQHLKADVARIDFFINFDKGTVKLNEVETVSGTWYEIEHHELGAIWRNGYLINGWVDTQADHWSARLDHVEDLRHRAENPRLREKLGHLAIEATRKKAAIMGKKAQLEQFTKDGLRNAMKVTERTLDSAKNTVMEKGSKIYDSAKRLLPVRRGLETAAVDDDGDIVLESEFSYPVDEDSLS